MLFFLFGHVKAQLRAIIFGAVLQARDTQSGHVLLTSSRSVLFCSWILSGGPVTEPPPKYLVYTFVTHSYHAVPILFFSPRVVPGGPAKEPPKNSRAAGLRSVDRERREKDRQKEQAMAFEQERLQFERERAKVLEERGDG